MSETKKAIQDAGMVALAALCGYDEKRCDVCSWPLRETIQDGCTLGNCSERGVERAEKLHYIRARQALRHVIAEARKVEKVREEAFKAACSKGRDPDPDSQAWQAGYRALGREIGLLLTTATTES